MALLAVLAAGQAVSVICESLCPAHAARTHHHAATAHAQTVHHHSHTTLEKATPTTQLDPAPAACCTPPSTVTATSVRSASTRQAIAIAAIHRVPALASRVDLQQMRWRIPPPLDSTSRAPILPTLRI